MANHRGGLECSVYPVLLLPGNFVRKGRGSNYRRTRKASSTMPGSMFVHVRCRIVSIPYSDWVKPARSRLLSLVEPPAPHVTLIAMG